MYAFVQVVRPSLHHDPPLLQVRCVVIRRTDLVPWQVGKLQLNVVVIEPSLGEAKVLSPPLYHAAR